MSTNNDQTPAEIDEFIPNLERDDPPCRQMAEDMERYFWRKRWFAVGDELYAIEKLDREMEAEVAWLYGLLAGGPV